MGTGAETEQDRKGMRQGHTEACLGNGWAVSTNDMNLSRGGTETGQDRCVATFSTLTRAVAKEGGGGRINCHLRFKAYG